MQKNHFQKELLWPKSLKKGDKGTDVTRLQEWIYLWHLANPQSVTALKIDNDFGGSTEGCVKKFQQFRNLPQTGIVDAQTFQELCSPLNNAFQLANVNSANLRSAVVDFGELHLANHARELSYKYKGVEQGNMGPWVRSYCDSANGQGAIYWWCLGFVQTILDLAYSKFGRKFTTHYEKSLLCDNLGSAARTKGILIKNADLKNNPALAQKGDLFLKRINTPQKTWAHVGIIRSIDPATGTIETLEGNASEAHSSNGWGVLSLNRNYTKTNLDIVKLID